MEFYIYGVMLMAAHVGITLAFGLSVQADAARFSSPRILLAKEILYLALSLISLAVGIVLLAAIFALPFRGKMWRILLICAIFYSRRKIWRDCWR